MGSAISARIEAALVFLMSLLPLGEKEHFSSRG